MNIKILAMCGSSRTGSYNNALLNYASGLKNERVCWQFVDISDIPNYSEKLDSDAPPETVLNLRVATREANAIVIATPEYNRSVPGSVKNAIDWISRPSTDHLLTDKPVLIMGASTGMIGSAFAIYHLRQILACLGAHVLPAPDVLLSFAPKRFDIEGRLIDDDSRQLIDANVSRMVRLTRALVGDLIGRNIN